MQNQSSSIYPSLPPFHSGWLEKTGDGLASMFWNRRFFKLENNQLSYYTDSNVQDLKGTINLAETKEIKQGAQSYFQIELPNRTYYLYASKEDEAKHWVNVLNESKRFHQTKLSIAQPENKISSNLPPSNPSIPSQPVPNPNPYPNSVYSDLFIEGTNYQPPVIESMSNLPNSFQQTSQQQIPQQQIPQQQIPPQQYPPQPYPPQQYPPQQIPQQQYPPQQYPQQQIPQPYPLQQYPPQQYPPQQYKQPYSQPYPPANVQYAIPPQVNAHVPSHNYGHGHHHHHHEHGHHHHHHHNHEHHNYYQNACIFSHVKRYKIKEKHFSLGRDMVIYEETGNEAFIVRGEFLSFGTKMSFQTQHNSIELAYISQAGILLPEYKIYRLGQLYATVFREFSFAKYKFEIEMADPSLGRNIQVHGDWRAYDFYFKKGERIIATVSKKFFQLRDTYGVEIQPGEDNILILAIVVIIERCVHG